MYEKFHINNLNFLLFKFFYLNSFINNKIKEFLNIIFTFYFINSNFN